MNNTLRDILSYGWGLFNPSGSSNSNYKWVWGSQSSNRPSVLEGVGSKENIVDILLNGINKVKEGILNSEYGDPDPERIPFQDTYIISSALENGDMPIPLIELLEGLIVLNLIEIIFILIIIFMFFSRYINKFYIKIAIYLINNYFPIKYQNKLNKFISKGKDNNNKFFNIMFVLLITFLFLYLVGSLYVNYELYSKIDKYVKVYNFLNKKDSCLLVLLSLNNYNHKLLNSKTNYNYKPIFNIGQINNINTNNVQQDTTLNNKK